MANPVRIREALIAIFDKLGGDSKKLVPEPSISTPTLRESEDAIKRRLDALEVKQQSGIVEIGGKEYRGVGKDETPSKAEKFHQGVDIVSPREKQERSDAFTQALKEEEQDLKAATKGVRDEGPRKLTPAKLQSEASAIESFDNLPRPLPKDAGPDTHLQELEQWDKFMEGSGSITKLRTKGRKGSKDPKSITTSDDIVEINERRDDALRSQIKQVEGTKNRDITLGNTPTGRRNVKSLAKDVVEADVADGAVTRAFGPDLEQVPGKVKLSPEGVKGTSELDNFSLRQIEDLLGGPDNPTTAPLREELSKAAQRSGRTRGGDQLPLQIPTKKKTFMNRFHPDSSRLDTVQEKLTGPLRSDVALSKGREEKSRILAMLEQRMQRELQVPQSPVGRAGPEQVLDQNELLMQIIKQISRGK